jgi:hypothetical protein
MVDLIGIASGIAGFGPALALLFYTLRQYTFPKVEKPYFDDRKIFAFFALGIVVGMLMFTFEAWGQTISSSNTLLFLVAGFAVMEELLKLIILNFPRFQRKVDTAFSGVSFGLGIASTFTFASIYSSALAVTNPQPFDFVVLGLLGLQLVLLHGSTTAYIGIGVARGQVKVYFSDALLTHLAYGLLMIPGLAKNMINPTADSVINILGLVGASAVVLYSYSRLYRQSLPALIWDAKRLVKTKQ